MYYDSSQRGQIRTLAYDCESKLDNKINILYYNIERWLVHNLFHEDVYYCPSCEEVRDEDDYDGDYDCCRACADSRREDEEDYYEDEDYDLVDEFYDEE